MPSFADVDRRDCEETGMKAKPERCPGCDEPLTRGDHARGYCPWCGYDLTVKGRRK